MLRYKIIRMYQDELHSSRVIHRGLSLADAQEHCRDPETSSSTATSGHAKQRTKRCGPWFDGYDVDYKS
jgi:hypothetical protein